MSENSVNRLEVGQAQATGQTAIAESRRSRMFCKAHNFHPFLRLNFFAAGS